MYYQQQNKWHPLRCNNITINYYYGQVNSLRLKSSVASKWASKHLWGYHLFCWRWYRCMLLSRQELFTQLCELFSGAHMLLRAFLFAWVVVLSFFPSYREQKVISPQVLSVFVCVASSAITSCKMLLHRSANFPFRVVIFPGKMFCWYCLAQNSVSKSQLFYVIFVEISNLLLGQVK